MMKLLIMLMLAMGLACNSVLADEPNDKQTEDIQTAVTRNVPSISRLSDIKSIYVEPFGGQGMEIVRDKVIMRLMKAGFCVVSSVQKADAILSADGQTSSHFRFAMNPSFYGYGSYASGRSIFETELAARLTSTKSSLLWAGEMSSGWPFNRSASASSGCVADRLVKRLSKDINKDRETQICKTQPATY